MYDTIWQTIQDDLPELEKMYVNLLVNVFEISLDDLSHELDFNYLPYCQELSNENEFQL